MLVPSNAIPLNTAVTPLAGNTASNYTPTFTMTATSTYSPTTLPPERSRLLDSQERDKGNEYRQHRNDLNRDRTDRRAAERDHNYFFMYWFQLVQRLSRGETSGIVDPLAPDLARYRRHQRLRFPGSRRPDRCGSVGSGG